MILIKLRDFLLGIPPNVRHNADHTLDAYQAGCHMSIFQRGVGRDVNAAGSARTNTAGRVHWFSRDELKQSTDKNKNERNLDELFHGLIPFI